MAKVHRCEEKLLQLDLSAKIYIVTGSNSGIGLETVRQLCKQGATVIMACRNMDSAQQEANTICAQIPNANLDVMELDLGDLESVRDFCDVFQKKYQQLDGLINNAGVMNLPQTTTKDGFEAQFGINHLGHFLLTYLLLEVIKRTPASRIINVSSCLHDQAMKREARIDFEDIHFTGRKYNGWDAYAQSKLANVLHAKKLAQLLEGTGVIAVSLHPGWVRTKLAKHSMPLWIQDYVLRPFRNLIGLLEPWDGAQTTLHCLLAEDVIQQNGAFYSQIGMYRSKEFAAGGWPMKSPNPNANNEAIRDQLWEISKEMVGLESAEVD